MTAPYRGLGERGTRPNADARRRLEESGCLGSQPQTGGKFRPRLNTGERPIANKYREGKMKRTLKRESKVLEIVERETIEASRITWQSHGAEGRPLSASAPRGDVQPPSWRPPRISGGASSKGPPRGSRRPCRGPGALPSPGRVSVGRDKKAAREGREGGSEASASGVQPLGRTRLAAPTEEEDVGKARALPSWSGGLRPHPARATDADETASTDPS